MKSSVTLAAAFTGSFFAVGIPYWQIPYSQASLPSDIWGFALLAVAALAAISRVVSTARFWSASLIVGAAAPAAVLARVIADVMSDPTSHNLWPLEIILSAAPGFLAAATGALIGGLLVRRGGA
jgi:hypothetical protein